MNSNPSSSKALVPRVYMYLLAMNCYYNLKPNFWSHCFNSPELKAQVRYDNEYIDGLLLLSASIFKGV